MILNYLFYALTFISIEIHNTKANVIKYEKMETVTSLETVRYIKTASAINKHSVKEDDGSYLTPSDKIDPSDKNEENQSKNLMSNNDDKKVTEIQSKEYSNCAAWQCIIAIPIACVLVGVIGLLAYVLVGSTGNYSTCCKINKTFIWACTFIFYISTPKYIKAYVFL